MKIIADSNLLIRITTLDDPIQAGLAKAELEKAETIALPMQALCEMVWVLSRAYKISATRIAIVIQGLLTSANVVTDRLAVETGLAMMAAGADFADGVIAHEGGRMGGEIFVSFDKQAVKSLAAQGVPARLLA